jgi:lysozyme
MANYLNGIDVSRWQGPNLNWNQVKSAGYSFAFIKTSDGSAYKEQFIDIGQKQANDAKAAGLKIGYYHFAHPTNHNGLEKDASDEANYFLATIGNHFPQPNFPLVLDFEDEKINLSPEESQTWINIFYSIVKDAGYEMIFYTYKGYIDKNLPRTHDIGRIPLWIASYPKIFSINKPPKLPIGWNSWAIWQYSESGKVAGIDNNTDLNIMAKDFFDWYT